MSSRPRGKFRRLLEEARLMPPTATAVAHPCDASSLGGAVDAAKAGIITPILVGPPNKVFAVARAAGLDITPYEVVDAEYSHAAADRAVSLVS